MQYDESEMVRDIFLRIDGWLTYHEGLYLFRTAKNCNEGAVVAEIGSWKGRSTVCLAKGSMIGNRVRIFAIDPHIEGTLNEFRSNIKEAGVDNLIEQIVKTSEEAARGWSLPIDFIFVDGSHEYEFVKKDFELWCPLVKDGGIIAFHDTLGWEGPRRVVDEEIMRSRNFMNLGFAGSIVYYTKVSSNNLIDRIKGKLARLLQKLEFRVYPYKFNNTRYRSEKIAEDLSKLTRR